MLKSTALVDADGLCGAEALINFKHIQFEFVLQLFCNVFCKLRVLVGRAIGMARDPNDQGTGLPRVYIGGEGFKALVPLRLNNAHRAGLGQHHRAKGQTGSFSTQIKRKQGAGRRVQLERTPNSSMPSSWRNHPRLQSKQSQGFVIPLLNGRVKDDARIGVDCEPGILSDFGLQLTLSPSGITQ